MTDHVKMFLKQCPKLKIISAAVKGYDNFDTGSKETKNRILSCAKDLLSEPTAELALTHTRTASKSDSRTQKVTDNKFNGWRPTLYGNTLINAKVGIIGMGGVEGHFAIYYQVLIAKYFITIKTVLQQGRKLLNIRYKSANAIHKVDILYPRLAFKQRDLPLDQSRQYQ